MLFCVIVSFYGLLLPYFHWSFLFIDCGGSGFVGGDYISNNGDRTHTACYWDLRTFYHLYETVGSAAKPAKLMVMLQISEMISSWKSIKCKKDLINEFRTIKIRGFNDMILLSLALCVISCILSHMDTPQKISDRFASNSSKILYVQPPSANILPYTDIFLVSNSLYVERGSIVLSLVFANEMNRNNVKATRNQYWVSSWALVVSNDLLRSNVETWMKPSWSVSNAIAEDDQMMLPNYPCSFQNAVYVLGTGKDLDLLDTNSFVAFSWRAIKQHTGCTTFHIMRCFFFFPVVNPLQVRI